MNLGNILVRLAYAFLAGIVAFLIVFVLGVAIEKLLDAAVGQKIEDFAGLIGLLVAVIYFFANPTPRTPVV